jgi:hypothetical protein
MLPTASAAGLKWPGHSRCNSPEQLEGLANQRKLNRPAKNLTCSAWAAFKQVGERFKNNAIVGVAVAFAPQFLHRRWNQAVSIIGTLCSLSTIAEVGLQ